MPSPNPSAPSRCLLLLAALAPALGACTDPNQFLPSYQPGGPQGIMGGTVTYSGPLPCTQGGHVVGAAVLLAFDARLLPPPEGLGTTAESLAAVSGDVLFGSVVDRLTFDPDPNAPEVCPDPGTSVTVSAPFTIGPVPGGVYQVRGFYDLHGQFNPAFSISKLPHQGDIAGGAVDNVSDVLKNGAAPKYRDIQLGTPDTDAMGNPTGTFTIPEQGSNIEGVSVTLALPLPLTLPVFYPSGVYYSPNTCQGGMVKTVNPPPAAPAPIACGPSSSSDACSVKMPSDYLLPVFSAIDPAGTEKSLIRVQLTAGVAPGVDTANAKASPFNLFGVPTSPPTPPATPTINLSWNGTYSAASSLVPNLFPLSIFSLSNPGNDLSAQGNPAIILQAITINQNLLNTVTSPPPANGPGVNVSSMVAGLVPAVICIDPADFSPTATATLLLSHDADCTGNPLLTNEQGTLDALKAQFGRPVVHKQGCLPQGRYQMNLVYGTGQAWSVPNETGICASSEPQSADGTQCSSPNQPGAMRARLSSEDVVLTIGEPSDPTWCAMHPTPPECMPAAASQ